MAIMHNGHGLGWNPQRPDTRDLKFAAPMPSTFPASLDLRPKLFPVYDQGQEGSCSSFAAGTAFRHARRVQHSWSGDSGPSIHNPNGEDYDISFAIEYYLTRKLEGTEQYDAGGSIRDAVKVLAQSGAAAWHNMPYVPGQFAVRPTAKALSNAANHKVAKYMALDGSRAQSKSALTADYLPVLGFTVYETFYMTGRDGIVPPASGRVLGGHAVVIVGWDDNLNGGSYILRNSWSALWGASGYFYMRYDELEQLSSDYWCVEVGAP